MENDHQGTFCMECGSRLAAPAPPAPPAPQPAPAPVQQAPPPQPQQYQSPPQQAPPPQYQAPPPQAYPPPAYGQAQSQPNFFQAPKTPTIKSIHLGEVLFLIAGALLVGIGFENLGMIAFSAQIAFILLGFLAIVIGLMFLGAVVMPQVLKPMDQVLDMLLFIFSIIFVLWGLIGSFANGVGAYGGFLLAAGLTGLAGMGLKMGMLK